MRFCFVLTTGLFRAQNVAFSKFILEGIYFSWDSWSMETTLEDAAMCPLNLGVSITRAHPFRSSLWYANGRGPSRSGLRAVRPVSGPLTPVLGRAGCQQSVSYVSLLCLPPTGSPSVLWSIGLQRIISKRFKLILFKIRVLIFQFHPYAIVLTCLF